MYSTDANVLIRIMLSSKVIASFLVLKLPPAVNFCMRLSTSVADDNFDK